MSKNILLIGIVLIIAAIFAADKIPDITPTPVDPVNTEPVFVAHPVKLKDGSTFELQAPDTYTIVPATQGLKRIRFMAWGPDRRLFLTDMYDLTDNTKGKIYILDKFDEATGTFASTTTYLSNLRNPHSVAFYEDEQGQTWIYIALTDKLVRYKYSAGDTKPQGTAETIATFPAYGLSYKYGGWHLTRTIAIHENKLYISVGSSCNSCEEKEPERASIIQMNPDGTDSRFFAKGLRNAVGMEWVNDELFATNMGSDHLGKDIPNEMMYRIRPGTHYGWPYCYVHKGLVHEDSSTPWIRNNVSCAVVPAADVEFPAHSAPLGLRYFAPSFEDQYLRDSFLVALHGSGNVKIGTGYKIVKVTRDTGEVTDFISGFLSGTTRNGRPVDILQYNNSSFFFTDDHKGVLYFVSLK